MESLTSEEPEDLLWALELNGMRLLLFSNRHGIDLDLRLRDCEPVRTTMRFRLCERHARELTEGLQEMIHFLDGPTGDDCDRCSP